MTFLASKMLNILQDLFESEELKIDSVRSKTMKRPIDELCVIENVAFQAFKLEKSLHTNVCLSKRNVFKWDG